MDSLCKVMDSRFRDMDSLCLANNNLCKGTECRPRCNSNGACLNNRTSMENHLAVIEPQQWVKLVRRWVLKLVFKSLSHFFVSRG